jgi:hypothetical protein
LTGSQVKQTHQARENKGNLLRPTCVIMTESLLDDREAYRSFAERWLRLKLRFSPLKDMALTSPSAQRIYRDYSDDWPTITKIGALHERIQSYLEGRPIAQHVVEIGAQLDGAQARLVVQDILLTIGQLKSSVFQNHR